MQEILSTITSIFLFLITLGILVFIHELGHYIAARLVNAKVEEFAIGLGWKLWGKKIGETEYRLNLLPLGGYVKILGESEKEKADDPRDLRNKTPLQRIFVMVAGVVMNFVLASIIYYVLFMFIGFKFYLPDNLSNFKPYLGTVTTEKFEDKVQYNGLSEGLGAKKSGMPDKGEIKSINGKVLVYSYEIPQIVQANKGRTIKVEVCNEECKTYDVEVNADGKMGVSVVPNYMYMMNYEQNKLTAGPAHGVNMIRLMMTTLGDIFSRAKTTGNYSEAVNTVSGPVGIYLAIDTVKGYGITSVIGLMADLSLVLAFMNILPIPALDGGRILLTLPELITRKPLNAKLEAILINVSFALLLILMFAIIIKDFVFLEEIKKLLKP